MLPDQRDGIEGAEEPHDLLFTTHCDEAYHFLNGTLARDVVLTPSTQLAISPEPCAQSTTSLSKIEPTDSHFRSLRSKA